MKKKICSAALIFAMVFSLLFSTELSVNAEDEEGQEEIEAEESVDNTEAYETKKEESEPEPEPELEEQGDNASNLSGEKEKNNLTEKSEDVEKKTTEEGQSNEVATLSTKYSGSCGDNVTWDLSTDGTLTISGSGETNSYPTSSNLPWYSYRSEVTKIVVSSGITSLGTGLFKGCSSATSVSFPSSLVTINTEAFRDCKSLTSVTIPDKVTKIGGYAFGDCTSLKSVTLGAKLSELTSGAFDGCTSLSAFSIASGNSNFATSDGVLFNKKKTTLVLYPAGKTSSSYTVPSSVKTIGDSSFERHTYLMKVTIPGSVKTIDRYAFYYCKALTTVSFNKGLEKIEKFAFGACSGLTTIKLPSSVTYVDSLAFVDCSNAKITYPSSLTKMEDGTYKLLDSIKIKGTYNYKYAYQVFDLVNKERKAQGKSELKMDKELLNCAMQRAAECHVYFGHTRPSGLSCSSISTKLVGENIAGSYGSASSVMKAWMNSSDHKSNILGSSYKSIGIGCFEQNGTLYWVQIFGTDTATTLSKPSNASKSVTIKIDPDTVGKISLSASSTSIKKGSKITLKATISNKGWGGSATIQNSSLKWSSSDKSVATVNSSGKVTGKKAGTSTIKAKTSNGLFSASKKIKVKNKVGLSTTKKTIGYKQDFNLSISGTGIKTVKWSTSNKKVAKIKKVSKTKYKVTGVKPGSATITAKVGSKKYKCKVTVSKICHTTQTLAKGKTHILALTGVTGTVKWSTSNKSVASIKKVNNKKYKITAKKKGTATIKAKVNGKTYKCKVTVTHPKMSKTSESLKVGKSINLSVSGSKGTIKWSTSNKNVASIKKVSNTKYKVTGKKKGSATIKAKVNGKTLKCKVKVK